MIVKPDNGVVILNKDDYNKNMDEILCEQNLKVKPENPVKTLTRKRETMSRVFLDISKPLNRLTKKALPL